jgi:hypothetical protein
LQSVVVSLDDGKDRADVQPVERFLAEAARNDAERDAVWLRIERAILTSIPTPMEGSRRR